MKPEDVNIEKLKTRIKRFRKTWKKAGEDLFELETIIYYLVDVKMKKVK